MYIVEDNVKTKKKIYWITGMSIGLILLIAIVGICWYMLAMRKLSNLSATVDHNVAVIFQDENDWNIKDLFGLQVTSDEEYWIFYEGYNTSIVSISMQGNLSIVGCGTTNVIAKICTENKTWNQPLTLHIVDRQYATNLSFARDVVTMNYLEEKHNSLHIDTKNGDSYNYEIQVESSIDTITYDAISGAISYTGEKGQIDTPLYATITCKVKTSVDTYLEKSFSVIVDFTTYATNFQEEDLDLFWSYRVHTNEFLQLNMSAVNDQVDEPIDVEVMYEVNTYPEGAEGYQPFDPTYSKTVFQSGKIAGRYTVWAKVQSGIDDNNQPMYIQNLITIDVVDPLRDEDMVLSVTTQDGKEQSSSLLQQNIWYTMVIDCLARPIYATNIRDLAIPEGMHVQYDMDQTGTKLYISFMIDSVGEYTFTGQYLDRCDGSCVTYYPIQYHFTVLPTSATTVKFQSQETYLPIQNNVMTLYLYDKNYENDANYDGFFTTTRIVLEKEGIQVVPFDVSIENKNILSYEESTHQLTALLEGETNIHITDPTNDAVFTYTVCVQKVRGVASTIPNLTLYLYEEGQEEVAGYPSSTKLYQTVSPIYAVKDWSYDHNILTWENNTLSAKKVGETTITLGGVAYGTITVVAYKQQDQYDICIKKNGIVLDEIVGNGYGEYTIEVYQNDSLVEGTIAIKTNGVYGFVKDNHVTIRYEEDGILTILVTIHDVTISKTVNIKLQK